MFFCCYFFNFHLHLWNDGLTHLFNPEVNNDEKHSNRISSVVCLLQQESHPHVANGVTVTERVKLRLVTKPLNTYSFSKDVN